MEFELEWVFFRFQNGSLWKRVGSTILSAAKSSVCSLCEKCVLSQHWYSQSVRRIDVWQQPDVHLGAESVTDVVYTYFLYKKLVLAMTVDKIIQSELEKQVETQIREMKFHNASDIQKKSYKASKME